MVSTNLEPRPTIEHRPVQMPEELEAERQRVMAYDFNKYEKQGWFRRLWNRLALAFSC